MWQKQINQSINKLEKGEPIFPSLPYYPANFELKRNKNCKKKNAKTPGVQFQAFCWPGVNEVLALCYCKKIQAIPKYAHAAVGFSIDLISGSGQL